MALGMNDIRQMASDHVNPTDLQGNRTWRYDVYDVFTDHVIIRDYPDKWYKLPYTDDSDEESKRITWGDMQEVQMQFVPVQESIRVFEAKEREGEGEGGSVFDVVLIRAGWSANKPPHDFYYGADMLQKAAPLYEGAKAYLDHSSKSEMYDRGTRSVKDLAGVYKSVRYENGALRGELHVLPHLRESVGALLRAAVEKSTGLVGLSHDADGVVRPGSAEGRNGRLVEEIRKVNSVDIVAEAAAGGTIEALLEGIRGEREEKDMAQQASGTVNLREALQGVTVEQLRESAPHLVKGIEEAVQGTLKAEIQTLREGMAQQGQAAAKMVAGVAAQFTAARMIESSNLPKAAQGRVLTQLQGATVPMKEGHLDETEWVKTVQEGIKGEQDYLSAIGGNFTKGAGAGSDGTGTGADLKPLQESVKKVLEGINEVFGVRSAAK